METQAFKPEHHMDINSMTNSFLTKTKTAYTNNIIISGVKCGLGQDILSKDGKKVFLKAGTPITKKISEKINQLHQNGVINQEQSEEKLRKIESDSPNNFLSSIMIEVKTNPILTQHQLSDTLNTIANFVSTAKLPEEILDHLTVFAKSNEKEFKNTILNLVFGTHMRSGR